MKRTRIFAAVVVSFGLLVGGASSASAATSACSTTSHQAKVGTTTTTDSVRSCTLANGGWSRTTSHKVSTTSAAGTSSFDHTVTTGHYVTSTGKASDRTTDRQCTKRPAAVTDCKTMVTIA